MNIIFEDYFNQWVDQNGLKDIYLASKIVSEWETIASKSIANRTSKVSVNNQILTLKIDNAPLKNSLYNDKEQWIAKINDYLGVEWLKDIYFC